MRDMRAIRFRLRKSDVYQQRIQMAFHRPNLTSVFWCEMEWIRNFYCSLEPIMLYCREDLLGGPKPFKVRSAVNLQVIL